MACCQRDCQSFSSLDPASPSLKSETPSTSARVPFPLDDIERSTSSPSAADTGARPPTALTTAEIVSSSAAPSDPCLGSFTSITSAPPARAASASAALRTLTSSPGASFDDFSLVMGCLYPRYRPSLLLVGG